jgi:hypothetical protein
MARQNDSKVRLGSRLRTREWSALGTGLVLGGLAGAALGYPQPGWVWSALACATIGASSAGVCVLGYRLEAGTAAIGLTACGVAGLEGLLLTYLALGGDSEKTDSLIGTTVMAIVLGMVCAAFARFLLSVGLDASEGAA